MQGTQGQAKELSLKEERMTYAAVSPFLQAKMLKTGGFLSFLNPRFAMADRGIEPRPQRDSIPQDRESRG